MARPERPLDATQGPIAAFAHDLRILRDRAGRPSYRDLARRALFAPSVLSSAASGHRLPTLAVTLGFVAACGGDTEAWARRWRRLAGEVAPEGPADAHAGRRRSPDADRPGGGQLAPHPPHPAQLPPGSTSFVGRRWELRRARGLLELAGAARLPLLVTGPMGTGKTTFALRLAEAERYPGGQLYADLEGAGSGAGSADVVISAFLRALGVPAALVPDNPGQRAGLYRSLLARRRVFVLIVGVRDEAQVRPLLSGGEHSQIVIASRARLLGLDDTHRIELGRLRREEAVELLGRLVGPERVAAERPAAELIAAYCDDLPWTVNIVGRRIAALPQWSLAYTAERLADEHQRLDLLKIGDVAVRDRLGTAYRLLAPAGRTVIDRLAAQGPSWITAVGVAAALDVSLEGAEATLETVVNAGLLAPASASGRYQVPGVLACFATENARRRREARSIAPRRTELSAAAGVRPRGRAAALVVRAATPFRSIRPLG